MLDRLPQTFVHFDTMRRNMMVRKNSGGEEQLYLLDWEHCGIGPVGADLAMLIAVNPLLFEIDLEDLETLEAAAFQAYRNGLRDAGWDFDPELVRLGYLSAMSMHPGTAITAFFGVLTTDWGPGAMPEKFGCAPEEAIPGWKILFDFLMDRSDEARAMIKRMGI